MTGPLALVDYQDQTSATAIYPDGDLRVALLYLACGLAEEAGEVAGKVKKWARRGGDPADLPTLLEQVADESGDVFWYMAQLFERLGGNLADVPQRNIDKCKGRAERGTLEGYGDDR